MFGNLACNLTINYLYFKGRIKSKFLDDLLGQLCLDRKRANQGRRLNKTVNHFAPFWTTVIMLLGGIPFIEKVIQNILSKEPL